MQVFLIENLSPKEGILSQQETQHCIKVLRHKPGDELMAIDGKGNGYRVRLGQQENRQAHVQILDTLPEWGEPGHILHLFASPLRLKDRFEWMVEKAVELGVSHIHPIACSRTDPYKAKLKAERLHTLLKTATKQTKRSRIPTLHPLTPFGEAVATPQAGLRLLAHCEAELPMQTHNERLKTQQSVEIWIGPEGDFTPEEVGLGENAGLQSVTLGTQRLRTETAAIYALSWAKVIWGY